MNAGVPITIPARVACDFESERWKSFAIPKSSTLSVPARVMKRFSGLMSLCTTLRSWAETRTSSSWSAIVSTSATGSRRALFSQRRSTVSPSRSSITMKAAPSGATSSSSTLTAPSCWMAFAA